MIIGINDPIPDHGLDPDDPDDCPHESITDGVCDECGASFDGEEVEEETNG
jgi:hypothetical protein